MSDEIGRHKCNTCFHGRVTASSDGRVETVCGHECDPVRVHGEVRACNQYEFKYAHSHGQDDRIAWVLEFRKGRPIGFRPPKNQNGDD